MTLGHVELKICLGNFADQIRRTAETPLEQKNDSRDVPLSQLLKKRFGMLRRAQHERKNSNDINISPFALRLVEGLLMGFSATCETRGRLLPLTQGAATRFPG
jgi:hypothetical protein